MTYNKFSITKRATVLPKRRIFYVAAADVESISDTSVTLKNGINWNRLEVNSINMPDEKPEGEVGIQVINQEVGFKCAIPEASYLNTLIGQYFIVVIELSDGTFRLMGSIDPLNPAILEISRGEMTDFRFIRQSDSFMPTITFP